MSSTKHGKVVTFYSYKGGTGRSMMLANVAWVLASHGLRILLIDWDLEAPGLYRYLHPFLSDKDLRFSEGVIDFAIECSLKAIRPLDPDRDVTGVDGSTPSIDIIRYAVPIKWQFPDKGNIDLIPAGRQDESYATRVNTFNWSDFYGRLKGGALIDLAMMEPRTKYDYIFIDSRTGVSDTSGICTVHLPEVLVVCSILNTQSIKGAAAVAESAFRQRKQLKRDLVVFPVPMRLAYEEHKLLRLRSTSMRDHFSEFL